MRSFAEHLRSIGYQYSNSVLPPENKVKNPPNKHQNTRVRSANKYEANQGCVSSSRKIFSNLL